MYATAAVTLDIFLYTTICIAHSLKKISKMSTLPPPGKISPDAHDFDLLMVYVAV